LIAAGFRFGFANCLGRAADRDEQHREQRQLVRGAHGLKPEDPRATRAGDHHRQAEDGGHVHPYRGNSGGTAGLSKRGSGKLSTTKKKKKKKKKTEYQEPLGDIRGTLGASTRSDFATPFSDNDKRMPSN